MSALKTHELTGPYDALLKKGRWDQYLALLNDQALAWIFNIDRCRLTTHLNPLYSRPDTIDLPPRVAFLCEAIEPFASPDNFKEYFEAFMKDGDMEAGAAAVMVGVNLVLESGTEFSRLEEWGERIECLLSAENGPSRLARSALLCLRGVLESAGRGDIEKSIDTFAEALWSAEEAEANSLAVIVASLMVYPMVYHGDYARVELLLFDTEPLCRLPDVSMVAKSSFRAAHAFFLLNSGEIEKAKTMLGRTVGHPLFNCMPMLMWAAAQGNYLQAVFLCGDAQEARAIAQSLQELAIPEKNHYLHAFLHYFLAMEAMAAGDSYKALIHSQESVKRIRVVKCPFASNILALLEGQTLSEMGEDQKAIDHLDAWIRRWQEGGYNVHTSGGALELANIRLRQGNLEEARSSYEQAAGLLRGRPVHPMRPPAFLEKLRRRLYPEAAESQTQGGEGEKPIQIETFGDLRLQLAGRTLADRKWLSGRTLLLLKAIIVLGGTHVSCERLSDMLWPDLEGDMVSQRLKMAIYRLRRTGLNKGERPLPWIIVKNKSVSLCEDLCEVDALRFQEAMEAALRSEGDIASLVEALDLFADDFLVNDINEGWIVRHRHWLRDQYILGLTTLTKRCIASGRAEEALPYLFKAQDKDSLNEELYAGVMRVYLALGYPANVLQVFKQATKKLEREVGVGPGATLIKLARRAKVQGGPHPAL